MMLWLILAVASGIAFIGLVLYIFASQFRIDTGVTDKTKCDNCLWILLTVLFGLAVVLWLTLWRGGVL
jgi:hypothetical protein